MPRSTFGGLEYRFGGKLNVPRERFWLTFTGLYRQPGRWDKLERYRDTPCLLICPDLREGKVVYGA